MSPGRFSALELRDLRVAERHAREVLRQCESLRENGPQADGTHFGMVAVDAWQCWRAAARADNRYADTARIPRLRWRLPKFRVRRGGA